MAQAGRAVRAKKEQNANLFSKLRLRPHTSMSTRKCSWQPKAKTHFNTQHAKLRKASCSHNTYTQTHIHTYRCERLQCQPRIGSHYDTPKASVAHKPTEVVIDVRMYVYAYVLYANLVY